MRTILFRGKVMDEPNEWVYGYLCRPNTIFQTIDNEKGCCGFGTFTVIPESIGQYTGCKDVDGVAIYEHDIVQLEHSEAIYFRVNYRRGSFVLDPVQGDQDMYLYFNDILMHDVKVVGNSYEIEI